MQLEFDIINILIALAAAGNLIYGWLVYARNKHSTSNLLFFLLTIAVSSWGISMMFFRSATNAADAVFVGRLLYASAITIPLAFYYFTSVFPSDTKMPSFFTRTWSLLLAGIVLLVVLTPSLFIQDVMLKSGFEPTIIFNPTLHLLYAIYVTLFFSMGFSRLGMLYWRSTGLLKTQVAYILMGAFLPTFLSLFSNVVLPLVGIFEWNWFGQVSTVFMTGLITYGIFRHRIFNVRVITTEVLIFFIWLTAFVRIIFAETQAAVIFNIFEFSALVLVGIWLIRSVTREIETREQLEELTTELQTANARLQELDQQKSEFLSIATHQLRGPLAGIRGHLSLIADGSYGKIPSQAAKVVTQVLNSSGLLAQTITDFLNVSRIEQGRMQYEMTIFECNELITDVVHELQPLAQQRKLDLSYKSGCDTCTVKADYAKLRHIFFNLIDNAIKYTEEGHVTVELKPIQHGRTVRIEISDSGIGIAKEDLLKLFEKFVRADDASGVNVNGTGLGLYVAREMVEVHHGKIWAESAGKGKGSTFIVELPITKKSKQKTPNA